MSQIGKSIRMERIINRQTKRTVIIPMDHGVTLGPVPGLHKMSEAVEAVARGGANAVVVHKGVIQAGYRGYGSDIGLIMHMSASTNLGPDPADKVSVADVDEAIKLGADAVSVHINIGSKTEPDQLAFLGRTAKICREWSMPLLAMMYPRGEKVKNEFDAQIVAHVARVGAELGADMIKTNYTGSVESFKEVVRGCSVPVVMAGGPKTETYEEFFRMVEDSVKAGGSGVSAGRNVFQADDPTKMVQVLCGIVHEQLSAEAAVQKYMKRI
jgi:fructose-bisphosphate aldolase/2-amino-3,7-dideoxy-D-threo-hept-6-ulosonate synthase